MKQQQLVAGGGGSGEYNDTTKDISKKSTNIGDSIPVDNSVAHYELPNLTQLLYDFTNKEQEIVQRCFRTGNYTYLRELPHNIAPNVLAKFMKDKIDQNLYAKPPEPKIARLTGGGLFQEFEWIPDSYDNFIKKKQEDSRMSKQQQRNISDRPFVLGTNNFRWKYEDCFIDPSEQKDYVFPFLSQDDPYEATRDEILTAKWLAEQKILHGEFKPALQDKSLDRITKQQLPDVVNYLKKVIMIDWAEVNFIIGTNPENFIEIKFDKKSVDTDLGLKAYMNTLISTHEVISQFNLKRVLRYWGLNDGKHLYFMLAPPWIRFNPAFVYSSIVKNQTEYIQASKELDGRSDDDERAVKSAGISIKNQASLVMRSNLLKDPQLYSKDIEI